MVFLVACIPVLNDEVQPEDRANLQNKIESLNRPFFKSGDLFFVSYEGTTSDLNKEIGLSENRELGFGIIIRITNYSGYAQKTLWEWVNTYDKT